MQTSEILLKAADYIGEHGHAKGTFMAPDESACLVGASHYVSLQSGTHDAQQYTNALLALGDAVIEVTGMDASYSSSYTSPIFAFNDHVSTTAEDAILMLKRAATR